MHLSCKHLYVSYFYNQRGNTFKFKLFSFNLLVVIISYYGKIIEISSKQLMDTS